MKRAVVVLLMVGTSGLVGLGITELLLQTLHLVPSGGVFTVTAREFASVPGIFGPDQRAIVKKIRELEYTVHIDSLGYRGAHFPRTKPDSELRVLFVGDSFVFGDFVEDEETLPAQLEAKLRARCSDVRVINSGLGGSTITEHVELLYRSLELDPDVVILLFTENDFHDLVGTPMWKQLAQNRAVKSRFPLSIIYPLVRQAAIWNLGLRILGVRRNRAAQDAVKRGSGSDEANVVAELRNQYERHLRGLSEFLREREIPLVFVAYPSHLTLHGVGDSGEFLRDQMKWVTSAASAAGIPTLDLTSKFKDTNDPGTTLYLLPYDGHPSPKGYDLASSYLVLELTPLEPFSSACSGRSPTTGSPASVAAHQRNTTPLEPVLGISHISR